ncbi:MAG: M13 family metallopeptidase [Bacilli bacterium]|nr:M13 family metallopeptidase [Bacilli bacterium]
MNIINRIKNIIKRKESVQDIINLSGNIIIQNRESLNISNLEKLDKIKEEYIEMIKGKILFSGDLDSKILQKEMNMQLELITNLFLQEDTNIFDKINGNTKLKMIIKSKKLLIYLSKIIEMKNEVELRLIALLEILKEVYLTKYKREIIKTKYENLTNTYIQFKTQGEAIGLDILTALNDIKYSEEEIQEKEILDKLKEVEECIKIAYPQDYKNYINREYENLYDHIAYLEIELEIYVYKNKNIFNDYFWKSLSNEFNRNDFTYFSFKTNSFQKIEITLKIFSLYGRNLVAYNFIEKLYYYKFLSIANNIYKEYDPKTFENLSYIEMECYDKIINKIIESILLNENWVLYELFSSNIDNLIKFIKTTSNLLKSIEYSTYNILNSQTLLTFILSFTKKNGPIEFFEKYLVSKEDYNFPQNSSFIWCQKIPLLTICKLIDYNYLEGINNPYYNLYVIIKDKVRLPNYILLKGLKEINFGIYYLKKDEILMEKINKKVKNKIIYTPNTLEAMNVPWTINSETLILNDGLKSFSVISYQEKESYYTLSIPSSLNNIYLDLKSKNSHIYNLIFRDYKNSKILNDRDYLKYFCSIIFSVDHKKLNDLIKDSYKDLGITKNPNNAYPVKAHFRMLTFTKKNKCFDIDCSFFNFRVYRNSDNPSNTLTDEELELLVNYIEKQILKNDRIKLAKKLK